MADKPSRALVIYGDGHANLVSPQHAHLHSFATRASCGFLSLRAPTDAQESENDRRIRELAQLLDAYDIYAATKRENGKPNSKTDLKDSPAPTISQRFMGLRAAIFTTCPDVGSFATNLGLSVLKNSELIEQMNSDVDPLEVSDNNAIVSKFLKLLGFSGGEVLEKYDFDLVFLHITPSEKLKDEKGAKVINTDVDFLNKLVGGLMHEAQPGSKVASRLHFSVVLGYGTIADGSQNCSLILNSAVETNSDLSLLRPHQSYTMKGGNILPDIR
ncbi:hypothetical protein Cni_G19371 [Canna indica]|uniref:Uncharacterized protein n=1 Tax=Canna indica TaxID=4628 RepID=A0AAQ3KN20_9LILI|nr:hypothetical protein Cni_G19371 [Canna indica]